jgi:DNA-binding NtrC family response regulator
MPDLLSHTEWEGGSRARVLVEAAEWPARSAIEQILRDAGYGTLSCPGPEGAGTRCALADDRGCHPAVEADVVVHALRAADPRNLEALRALRRVRPETPVIVEAPPAVAAQRAEDFAGCIVIDSPMTATALIDAVEEALAGS